MKKIISILICIQIALFPAFAFAANVGGWTLGGGVAQGASTVYEGTKRVVIDGADYIKKGTALITPSATRVAKVLAGGAATIAIDLAVKELLGAVDWVLDPANNQIKYWDEPGKPYFVGVPGSDLYGEGATREEACKMYAPLYEKKYGSFSTSYWYGTAAIYGDPTPTSTWWCYLNKQVYDNFTPNAVRIDGKVNVEELGQTEGEVKTYPLPAIADYLIKKAGEGNTTAQVATTAAAADIVAEAEKDDVKARPIVQQLEASAQTKPADESAAEKANEAQGQSKPNTQNPEAMDLSLEFPVFCGWAPLVCEAAQTVISFPTTLTDWWNTTNQKADSWASSISEAWASVKEWATGEPDLQEDQTDLPVEEQTLDRDPSSFDTDYIVLGSQCPTFDSVVVEVGPISKLITMDLSPLCDFAAQVRPAILGMSYLTAAGIVVAAIRET